MSSTNGRWEFDENGNVHYIAPEEPPEGHTDGACHYTRQSGQPRHSGKNKDNGWHWILIVLGYVVWWPIGLALTFVELSGKWPGDKKVEQELKRAAGAVKRAARQAERAGARQKDPGSSVSHTGQETWQKTMEETRAAQTRKTAQNDKRKKRKQQQEDGAAYGLGHTGVFRTVGGIMAGLFGFAFVMEVIDDLRYFMGWEYLVGESAPLLALCLIGLTLVGVAGSRRRKLKRFQKYMSMIGSRNTVSIAALAAAMGCSEKKVEKDLEEMLDRDFWDNGYVDATRRMLVLGELAEDEPQEPEPQKEETGAAAEDNATATLRHIRSVNDAIANPELSQKIARIEELTAKIFKLLEERPEKAGELRGFMSYYLPQTLKILESYSKLEAQGIEGENIAGAKQKIESMMDKLVDGYETQLDKLFADDVLDISADLKVMESMLEQDGLTADNELRF